MRSGDRLAATRIHLGMRVLSGPHLSGLDDADVHDRVSPNGLRIGDADHPGSGAHEAFVADLSAALRVEGSDIQEEPNLLTFRRDDELPMFLVEQRDDPALRKETLVADELARRHGAGVEADRHLLPASRARRRCSSSNTPNRSVSTVRPTSAASSSVSCRGNPNCSAS